MHAWENFVKSQEAELGFDTVQKWLKSLKIIHFDACNLHLEAKDAFQAAWFEEHIRKKAQAALINNNNKQIKVHLFLANPPPKSSKSPKDKKTANVISNTPPAFSLAFDELDPYCTFDHFNVSERNLFTYRVIAQMLGEGNPSATASQTPAFNPVFIYGSSGSGKTHLLMATAQALRQKGLKVIYTRAQTFTDHVVSAIRAGEMSAFRQEYRNSDVLIVDDVHIFSRKRATQEEFFHTFNTLHIAGKQIILSANCAPNELEIIEPRLISRFEWGIVLELETLSREEIKAVITKKTQTLECPLHAKVIDFLLDTFQNCKKLNRALEALILRLHLNYQSDRNIHKRVTVATVEQLLADLIAEEQQSALTPELIFQNVAEFFGIRVEDILGKAQTRDCVLPRQLSMYLCRQQLKIPYIQLGDIFSRDHSTVMSSVKLIQKGIDTDDANIAPAYRAIFKKIKA